VQNKKRPVFWPGTHPQGRGVNGMDRRINFYLGHAECNNKNDETCGKEQNIQKYLEETRNNKKTALREGLKQ